LPFTGAPWVWSVGSFSIAVRALLKSFFSIAATSSGVSTSLLVPGMRVSLVMDAFVHAPCRSGTPQLVFGGV